MGKPSVSRSAFRSLFAVRGAEAIPRRHRAVTESDEGNLSAATTKTEVVKVNPLAPTINWSPATPAAGLEGAEAVMRFALIDALRGIAALSVLFFHAFAGGHTPLLHDRLPNLVQWPLNHGNLGVSVFFVLSGFVISHSLLSVDLTRGMAARFMLRRSLRLDPSYWFAIAVGCVAVLIKGEPPFTAMQIGAHLLYAQDLLDMPAIATVFWTLCLEMQFYVVFALLLLCKSRNTLIAAFVLSIPLSQFAIWNGLFTTQWYGFLLGVVTYVSWKDRSRFGWFLAYAGCLAVLAFTGHDLFMSACVGTACFILLLGHCGKLETYGNWGALQFLGMISYSLYLIHDRVVGATFRIAPRFPGNGLGKEIASYGAALILSIMVAFAMWFAIERPSMRLARMLPLTARGSTIIANA
ncbi:acyltransferase family protein [Bradyrhizobium sp. WSM471]|uniref:acyltransferase family protein n=1 Tax=Bradyrhizobium sp. WSM471 TaxID=319017 RepID=UPI00024D21C5|nr:MULTISPECIES: acyltransferase [Bradyrhizobium]EHR01340.1 putative acyltransferase [Bradyrhizobium sp. WSM471]UFW43400.1 acyltransferase [Bradyrhizobium canariense]